MQFFFYIIFAVLITYILPTFNCRCQPSYKISSKHLNPRMNYNNFFKFKMAADSYLGFFITCFWTIGHLGLCFYITVPNSVQKCCSTPNYGPNSKSKMAAVRHLGFPKTLFLNTRSTWAADFPSLYQIWRKKLMDAEIVAQNRNQRWRPFGILDFRQSDFWPQGPIGLPIFHLGTKFGAEMLINAEIMAKIRNPPSSAILDLSHHHIGPPTKSIHWATSAFQILC